MEENQLRHLRSEAMLQELQEFYLGERAFEGNVAVAYVVNCEWKVRVVPKHDVRININIADSTRYLSGEDKIYIAFFPFEDETEVLDYILPLLETETYRERQDSCCGEACTR